MKKLLIIIFLFILVNCAKHSDEFSANKSNNKIIHNLKLTENTIKHLFTNKLNEDKNYYQLESIKTKTGMFTRKNVIEGVASFDDSNQCNASGAGEIWLLRYNKKWEIIKKLEDGSSGGASFKTIDINKDSINEIWITRNGGGQGNMYSQDLILSLENNSSTILFVNYSYNDCAPLSNNLIASNEKHEISFKDIDDDGIFEIIERIKFEREKYIESKDNFIKLFSSEKTKTYKLIDKKYKEIKSK